MSLLADQTANKLIDRLFDWLVGGLTSPFWRTRARTTEVFAPPSLLKHVLHRCPHFSMRQNFKFIFWWHFGTMFWRRSCSWFPFRFARNIGSQIQCPALCGISMHIVWAHWQPKLCVFEKQNVQKTHGLIASHLFWRISCAFHASFVFWRVPVTLILLNWCAALAACIPLMFGVAVLVRRQRTVSCWRFGEAMCWARRSNQMLLVSCHIQVTQRWLVRNVGTFRSKGGMMLYCYICHNGENVFTRDFTRILFC